MSECVVRMEMPESCEKCPACDYEEGNCLLADDRNTLPHNGRRRSWCPILCQLPEGHGDLVDWIDIENELDRTFRVIVDDGPCAGSYIREYPQSLIEQPIRVRIIVPEDTAERSEI